MGAQFARHLVLPFDELKWVRWRSCAALSEEALSLCVCVCVCNGLGQDSEIPHLDVGSPRLLIHTAGI